MAIDPDVDALLEGVYARLVALEAAPIGSGAGNLTAFGDLSDLSSVVNFLDILVATTDDEDSRLAERVAAVDISALPQVPLPIGGGGAVVDVGTRHVTEDGNDTADGLSWATAMASPQAAYDSLVAWAAANLGGSRQHVGTVKIGRAFYDLDEGLNLNLRYTADFVGEVNTRLHKSASIEGTTMLGSSSTTASELVVIPGPTTNDNAYGFRFYNLGFRPQPQMSAVLRTNDANFTTVKDCFARPLSGELDGFFIVCDGDWDNSWWDIQGNRVHGMGLIQAVAPTTNNQNRWYVANNQTFCSNPNLKGMIDIFNVFDSTFIGNNLEGDMVAVHAEKCGSCTFINNAGESTTDTYPAYVMPGGWWNIIMGGRWQIPNSTNGVFLDRAGGGSPVTVINPQATFTARLDGAKNRIIDPDGTVTLVGGFT